MRLSCAQQVTAASILAIAATSDAIFTNVEISNFVQSGLKLNFRVSWDTLSKSPPDGADLIDIWLLTRQPDPSSWMETALVQVGVARTTASIARDTAALSSAS